MARRIETPSKPGIGTADPPPRGGGDKELRERIERLEERLDESILGEDGLAELDPDIDKSPSGDALERAVAEYTARYAIGEIPRPAHWSGFRIVPQEIEFWHDRPFRLHDRVKFTRAGDGWEKTRLYP